MPTMKNWSIVTTNPYQAPELQGSQLCGEIYGDLRFDDGSKVTTGTIIFIKDCEVYKQVSTKRTDYIIYKEDVDPDYEKCYENAYDRLQFNNYK